MELEQLDKLGKFIIENIRDSNIDMFNKLLNPQASSLDREFRDEIRDEFTPQQLHLIRKIIIHCTDSTISQLLWNLDKSNNESDISICIENQSISEEDHYLQSMYYSDEGWIAKFSKHYDENDV
jgi:hypothetical protein